MKKLIAEFREFAMKGDALELAVGVVLGAAFNSIVSSLVKDIIMPFLSILLGRINLANLSLTIPGLPGFSDIVLTYGQFLQAVLNFFVVALALFLCVKLINRMKEKLKPSEDEKAAAAAKEASLSKSEQLLTEIRDLLNKQEKS